MLLSTEVMGSTDGSLVEALYKLGEKALVVKKLDNRSLNGFVLLNKDAVSGGEFTAFVQRLPNIDLIQLGEGTGNPKAEAVFKQLDRCVVKPFKFDGPKHLKSMQTDMETEVESKNF